MIYDACFWTDESNFDKIRKLLKEELGCVRAKEVEDMESTIGELEPPIEEKVLVYENEQGVGIYRVHFKSNHEYGPNIMFRYFFKRVTPEIESKDPMRKALLRTYEILKPVNVTNIAMKKLDLESMIE